MLLGMKTKRILDVDLQLNRLFGQLLHTGSYEIPFDESTKEMANGTYDLVFTHRDSMNHEGFGEIKEYLKPETKIICDITTESGNIQDFLDEFKQITDTHEYEFYLVVDSDLTEYLNNTSVKYKTIDSHTFVFYAFLNPKGDNLMTIDTKFSAYENTFMSLNNSCRMHRVFLFSELIKRGIPLDNCSFLFTTGGPNGSQYNEQVYLEQVEYLTQSNLIDNNLYEILKNINLPISKDVDCSTNPKYISNKINEEVYKPILNLVTENLFGMTHGDITKHGLITFTEKTIKPFQARQIPLIIGQPGLIDVLRKLGFDMFDDLIDYSFETENNPPKRLQLIVDELERIMGLDLVEFKNNNIKRFENNYQNLHIVSGVGRDKIKSFLYNDLLI